MNENVIETRNVSKIYGKNKAVKNISMHVPQGAIYGIIGKNGAGKTTLMKMLTGLSKCSEGEIILFDEENTSVSYAQKRIGLLIEAPGVYENMTAYDNLKLKAIGMGVYNTQDIKDIIDLVGLRNAGNKKVKNFSLGMKQRLGIGLALIGSPDLLILDEPINGLDPQGIIEVRQLIEKLNQEKNITVLISSHILVELYKVVTHIGIIDKGELVIELTKHELDEKCKKKLMIKTNEPNRVAVILEEMQLNEYSISPEGIVYLYDGLDRVSEINIKLVQEGIMISALEIQNDNLEDFYMSITED